MAPLFFVSHATRPFPALREASSPVSDFFAELSNHMNQLNYRSPEVDVGFIDRALSGGASWEAQILTAVGSSQVLLALLSDPYINSEWCGREWDAFARRPVWRRADSKRVDPSVCILPVIWTPVPQTGRLPLAITRRQWFTPEFDGLDLPRLYRREGLYGLARARPDAYSAVVWVLAKEVTRLVHEYWTEPLIPSGPDELVNAFGEH